MSLYPMLTLVISEVYCILFLVHVCNLPEMPLAWNIVHVVIFSGISWDIKF